MMRWRGSRSPALQLRVLLGIPVVHRGGADCAAVHASHRPLRRRCRVLRTARGDRGVRAPPVLLPCHRARFRPRSWPSATSPAALSQPEDARAAVPAVRGALPLLAVWFAATYAPRRACRTIRSSMDRIEERFASVAGAARRPRPPRSADAARHRARLCCCRCSPAATFSRKPERWLPVALGIAVFLLLPHYVMSTAYFFQRLGLFLVPLWLMAWDPPGALRRRVDGLAIAVVLLWLVHEHRPLRGVRARDRKLPRRHGGRAAAAHRRLHGLRHRPARSSPCRCICTFRFGIRRKSSGIVDFNFANFFSQMVRFRRYSLGHDRRAGLGPRPSSTGRPTAASATTTS